MMRLALCLLLAVFALPVAARNWQLALDAPVCDSAGVMTLAARVRYLGAKAPVESPVVRLVDPGGRSRAPRGLVWKAGSRSLATLMAAGGVRSLDSGEAAELWLRFEAGEASGPLKLEFGDLPAVTVAGKGPACRSLVKAPAVPAQTRRAADASRLRIYRHAYPCRRASGALSTIEADHPPYLPKQLLLFGRGFLPNARHIDLPMGRAPAQSYFYSGANTLNAIEDAARRAIGADFPAYVAGGYFALNWGQHRDAAGNQIDSVGLYETRPCAG